MRGRPALIWRTCPVGPVTSLGAAGPASERGASERLVSARFLLLRCFATGSAVCSAVSAVAAVSAVSGACSLAASVVCLSSDGVLSRRRLRPPRRPRRFERGAVSSPVAAAAPVVSTGATFSSVSSVAAAVCWRCLLVGLSLLVSRRGSPLVRERERERRLSWRCLRCSSSVSVFPVPVFLVLESVVSAVSVDSPSRSNKVVHSHFRKPGLASSGLGGGAGLPGCMACTMGSSRVVRVSLLLVSSW